MQTATVVNGVDTDALRDAIRAIAEDPSKGQTRWQVTTRWQGGTRSDTLVRSYNIGGQTVEKDFTISIDEPCELCGTNQYANPQEYLMAAMNACMTVGYVTACAMKGIELEDLWIETQGEIDLRGFLGIDPDVKPGYDEIRYTVHIKAKNAGVHELNEVHDIVSALSPNRFNVAHAIRLDARLVVETARDHTSR